MLRNKSVILDINLFPGFNFMDILVQCLRLVDDSFCRVFTFFDGELRFIKNIDMFKFLTVIIGAFFIMFFLPRRNYKSINSNLRAPSCPSW
jgi:hypothetical protein